MNITLIILVVVLLLIALRLLSLRLLSRRPPTGPEKTAELPGTLLERAARPRFHLSGALFYFIPWLERAVAPSEAATAELLGRQSTRHLEASAKRLLLAGVPGGLLPNEWLGLRYLTGALGALVGAIISTLLVVISGRPILGPPSFSLWSCWPFSGP